MGPGRRLVTLFANGDDTYRKYSTADGMSFRDAIDAEQVLKSAEDLTDGSYWATDGVTPTEPSTGVFRLTKTAAADKYIGQALTNWFQEWAGTFSVFLTVTSDDLTAMSVGLIVDGADAVSAVEVVTGNAGVAIASSIANITGIDGDDSVIRITGSATAWATSVVVRYYPDKANTTAGYVDVSLSQMVLGNTAKPRPTQTDQDDWMLAYRPYNRVFADGAGRFSATDTEGKMWCGNVGDTAAAPTSGTVTGIQIAGGKATPAYGDPGIWITQPDGSAFSVGEGDAVMFTAKTFVSLGNTAFGFADSTSGEPSPSPRFRHVGNVLNIQLLNETPQTWPAGTTLSFMQLLRSDTHGSQFLLHDEGKSWKRFNVNDGAIPAASAYPAIANYNASLFITNFALLDLSPLHSEEFVGVTDSDSSPVANDTYTCPADCEITLEDITLPSSGDVTFGFRVGDNDNYMGVRWNSAGNVLIRKFESGWTTLVSLGDGTASNGSDIVITAHGSSLRIVVDGTSNGTAISDWQKTAAAAKYFTGATGGAIGSVTIHPYPSLGGQLGATDRVVAPQASDTGTADANCLAVLRATQVPSAGNLQVELRKAGSDEITYDVDSAGKPILYDNATARITGVNGDVTSDDDNYVVLDAGDGEIFTNGASDGSTASIAHLAGTTWNIASLGTGGSADALELWSRYANIFKV